MMEWWNIGIMGWRPSGRLNACGGDGWVPEVFSPYQLMHEMLLFHHSIIPLFLFGICRMIGWRCPIINNL
jgi:hypothetical protein